ncbi:lipase/acyltransferase domain-containing protein [Achromobacter kerstersii]|uniref:PGAP1-like alpha/beta domain-containing protein n=1 Tax=Achromobacter kerstersii TaxID=1353890 RepID=UPI0006C63810|nr:hypothetical protein [Achromobacter kerstersii]CUJ52119.1 PGAP1-like protein [Achromobacter kerstersii]
MTEPTSQARVAPTHYDARGQQCFTWTLTDCKITDPVQLRIGPDLILPVIFIPGVMGSNLKSVPENPTQKPIPVWTLNYGFTGLPTDLLSQWFMKEAGFRQTFLHPDRVQVDDQGDVPQVASGMVQENRQLLPADRKAALMQRYRERGWGEVGQISYERFLLWLEHALNSPIVPRHANYTLELGADHWLDPEALYPQLKPGMEVFMPGLNGLDRKGPETGVKPLTSDDLIAGARFNMPVHAFGYNWLASNTDSAKKLKNRINTILEQYGGRCKQVILLTHSMGGLIARMCATLPGMETAICGIIHGVMPTNGAPVAYRRCKVGMGDESFGSSLVIGSRGQDVTAVFAQSPGALQLLPTRSYTPNWLKLIRADGGRDIPAVSQWPSATQCPYETIYLERKRWWGLVRESWLAPKGGVPIDWKDYEHNVGSARSFHDALSHYYHPNTYAFYGSDTKHPSFESIRWTIRAGLQPPGSTVAGHSMETLADMDAQGVRYDGRTPAYVGGKTVTGYDPRNPFAATARPAELEYSEWELHCEMQDGSGDGTVPTSSGRAPIAQARNGQVREQLQMRGFNHEGPFRDSLVQLITLQWILKIAAQAETPA